MSVPFVSFMIPDACSGRKLLLFSHVPSFLRIWLLCAAISLSGFAKDIRLRNELIHTPEKAAGVMRAQGIEAVVDGLYIVQFERPINDEQRARLAGLNVELVQAIPENAFVARLNGARLGTV